MKHETERMLALQSELLEFINDGYIDDTPEYKHVKVPRTTLITWFYTIQGCWPWVDKET